VTTPASAATTTVGKYTTTPCSRPEPTECPMAPATTLMNSYRSFMALSLHAGPCFSMNEHLGWVNFAPR
jgi:hypothetical protein